MSFYFYAYSPTMVFLLNDLGISFGTDTSPSLICVPIYRRNTPKKSGGNLAS